MANRALKSIKFPGLSDTYTIPQVDNTLAVSGAAADAKKTGDQLNDLKSATNYQFNATNGALFENISSEYLTTWSNEYIKPDGTIGSSTKLCRTNFKQFTNTIYARFAPVSGRHLTIIKYSSNTQGSFVGFVVSQTTEPIVLDVSTGYYCFVVGKTSNETISTTEASSSVLYHKDVVNEKPWNNYVWLNGYIALNGQINSSSTRVYTNGYINSQVVGIKAVSGFYFRVHAFQSDGTYEGTYTTNNVFGKTGSSNNLTEFNLSHYSYAKYKLTVLKTDDAAIYPQDAQNAIYQSVFNTEKYDNAISEIEEDIEDIQGDVTQLQTDVTHLSGIVEPNLNITDISPVNLCLAGLRTPLIDSQMPYHEGFLCHKFVRTTDGRELFYGPSFDKLKSVGSFVGAEPWDKNFAISPKDGSIIFRVYSQNKWQIRVCKNGSYTNTDFVINKPWLYNSGVDFIKDSNGTEYCVFAEYGGDQSEERYVYRGSYPYTSQSDWEKVLTVTGETDIHHFHMVRRDPWTNILYLTSGDSDAHTHWWYSTDCGENWTLLVNGADKTGTWGTMACRCINFIFTEDYIYWATDSYQNHMLCRIQRNSNTGVIDLSTFEKLTDLKPGCATNSLCYSEAPHGLFMYERIDSGAEQYYGSPVTMQFYSLDTNTLEDVLTLGLTEDTWGGNRGKCYVNYTNPNQPYPAMGFDGNTPCIFDLNYDDASKIGTIVYDVNGKTVKNVLL